MKAVNIKGTGGGLPKNLKISTYLVALLMGDQELFTESQTVAEIWSAKVGVYAGIFVNLYREIQIYGDQK